MAHILDLPKEILLIIFNYILQSENQKYFLSSISKVCKAWELVCQDAHFWRKIDGSLPLNALFGKSKNGSFLKTEELICGPTVNLNYFENLDELFAGMPNLKSINFSKVLHLDKQVIKCLKKHCKNVSSIKLPKKDISITLLDELLENHGQNLLVLDLSGQSFNLKKALLAVSKSCFNLEELVLQNVDCVNAFPLKEIQENCSKMKVLRLGMPIKFSKYSNSENLPGFPMLEVFSHPNIELCDRYNQPGSCEFFDKDLRNLLSNSPLLKLLDIRGSLYITVNGILALPATHVESLYLSMSKLCLTGNILEILNKWIRSLRSVDISRMTSFRINEVLVDVTKNGRMINLEQLDLNNTKINAETIIKIIENCANLNSVNLSSCREVGRGCMREFKNRSDLLKLHEKLLCRLNE
ncbi:F-box/LRR-repeat protein 6 [Parasteatoda tepidariorum]|uniref:F-box/LRR-repeat protein 6 n=1 Tax=Parasteatoda tepidariorum TaxID=114398 RepID=UPI001C724445|nr:F-box/LRR-repeat protein fbxl-1 [Parasteatoda tepidariorum]